MDFRSFALQLAALSLSVWVLLVIVHQIPSLGEEQNFSWITWGVFIVLSMFMFVLGKKSAYDENKSLFLSMSIFLGATKMLIAVVLVVGYSFWQKPSGQGFVIPFFLIYLCFTIFETYFMMKLSFEGENSNTKKITKSNE